MNLTDLYIVHRSPKDRMNWIRNHLGIQLTPTQQTVVMDDSVHRIAVGMRRSGKTTLICAEALERAINSSGSRIGIVCHSEVVALSVAYCMELMIQKSSREVRNAFSQRGQDGVIRLCNNGSEIRIISAQSFRQSSVQAFTHLYVDEHPSINGIEGLIASRLRYVDLLMAGTEHPGHDMSSDPRFNVHYLDLLRE